MSAFDKSKEKQRQIDLMKMAVGIEDFKDEEEDEGGLTKRGHASPSSNPSTEAMESARRFLWDEEADDEDVDIPLGAPSPNISLTGTQNLFAAKDYEVDLRNTSAPPPPRSGFMGGMFRARGSSSSDHNLSKYGDATSRESEDEYISKKNRRVVRNSFSACLALCRKCYHWKCVMLLIALVVVFIGIGGVIKFINGRTELPKSSPEETVQGSASGNDGAVMNSQMRFSALQTRLIDSPYVDSSQFKTEGSPQSKALDWLANQDPSQIGIEDEFMLQRYAVAVFFFATLGDGAAPDSEWTMQENWMTGKGYCSWYGVECIGDQTSFDGNADIINLNLTSNSLEGNIQAEIRAFTKLEGLDLSSNNIYGTIPIELTAMNFLRFVSLNDNNLQGPVPEEFGGMTNLRQLNLGQNSLTGKIPSSLNQATNLRALSLERNSLQGSIPSLQSLKHLELLYLDRNKLEGEIPLSLFALTNLIELQLGENHLSGTIPDQLRNLDKLEILHLTQNKFEGPLPDLFERLTKLVDFYVGKNKFTGTLPGTIGQLSNVEHFVLDENQFSGPLHENIRHLKSIKELQLQFNAFSGSIPDDVFENMSNLELLMLYENKFVGSIPKSLGSCTKLREVFLEVNQLSGEVPTELGSLQSLERLSVDKNSLTGTMPDEVCGLTDGGVLGYLAADCKENEIACSCCHKCS